MAAATGVSAGPFREVPWALACLAESIVEDGLVPGLFKVEPAPSGLESKLAPTLHSLPHMT